MHHLLGQAYAAANRPDDAEREFRAAVERDPQLEAYAFDLGQMQLRRGDFAGATATLGKACQRFPDSAQMQLAHGVAAYGQRRCADAIDAFLRVTAINRAVEQLYEFLARILGQADDRLPQVVAAFAAWEKAEPGNYRAVRLHAKALSAASADATEIEEKLRRSIQLSDGYWESHFELGVLLGKKREPKGCRFESYLGSQFFISLPAFPFPPCFDVFAWFDSRNSWGGFLRVLSNHRCCFDDGLIMRCALPRVVTNGRSLRADRQVGALAASRPGRTRPGYL
jgi:tetratricopeptide (TPR) repeat protein